MRWRRGVDCRNCYGTGYTYWPVGDDLMEPRPCTVCHGTGEQPDD